MPTWINRAGRSLRPTILILFVLTACGPSQIDYGNPPSNRKTETIRNLVERPEAYLEKEVAVDARIVEVCQTAGCWCILADGADQLYVSMNTFALPSDVAGNRCHAEGKLVERGGRLTLVATGISILED